MKKKLWIVGQRKGEWKKGGSVWEFQGVFSSEDKADKACITTSYFYFSAMMDKELPLESSFPNDGKYPRC